MNPEETPNIVEPLQIMVWDVYEKMNRILCTKPSVLKSKQGKIMKSRIDSLFEQFKEIQQITPDFNTYNLQKFSIIDSTHPFWMTWFSYKLLTLPKSKVLLYLDDQYMASENKEDFVLFVQVSVLGFLSPINIQYFQSSLDYIAIWIREKKGAVDLNKSTSTRYTGFKYDEVSIRTYFNQLVKPNYLTQNQVDLLLKRNFGNEPRDEQEKLHPEMIKSHLTYFVYSFFQKYGMNNKHIVTNTLSFLTRNFSLYDDITMSQKAESNFRKNLKKTVPKKYPFKLLQ
jgi:hypothetical protein